MPETFKSHYFDETGKEIVEKVRQSLSRQREGLVYSTAQGQEIIGQLH